MSEFSIIQRFFTHPPGKGEVALGVGDDAALLRPRQGQVLALTVDTQVEGIHFPLSIPPEALGHRCLAVNLSDLAAMGAEPAWATLALTLPEAEERWLAAFSRGFFALAEDFSLDLIGGDTCHGPLSVTVCAGGWVPEEEALRRDGARPGDRIFVTGILGEAGLGLLALQGKRTLSEPLFERCLKRLYTPEPRIREGMALRGIASAAIDISDGLVADLGHILQASGVGAKVDAERLPVSKALRGEPELPLTFGDDYELLFTVPPEKAGAIDLGDTPWTEIGVIEEGKGLSVTAGGRPLRLERQGYDHFL